MGVLIAQPYCDVRTFSVLDGLASNTISGCVQDSDGLLWFSTWNGISLYDGYQFHTFRNEPGEKEMLTTNRISLMKNATHGNLWLVTPDRRVYLFDTKTCHFVNVGEMIKQQFGHDVKVRNVYPLDNGYTWVVSNDDNSNYRIDDRLITKGEGISCYSRKQHNLKDNILRKIVLDDEGGEWVFSNSDVWLLGTEVRVKQYYEHFVPLKRWIVFATPKGKVKIYDKQRQRFDDYQLPRSVSRINKLVVRDHHKVLLATNDGVVEIDVAKRRHNHYSVQMIAQHSPEATSLFVDSRQRAWVFTSEDGVVLLDLKSGETHWMNAEADSPLTQTLSEQPFVHEDRHHTVWVVPQGGTFAYFDEERQQLCPYVIKAKNLLQQSVSSIVKYCVDKQQNLWFTGSKDVCQLSFRYNHFKVNSVMSNDEVRSLLTDRDGRTWAGTRDGFLVVFDADHRRLGFLNRSGKITQQRVHFSEKLYALYQDIEGRLWIGTKGEGLFMLSPDGKFTHYHHDAKDNWSLSSNDVYDVVNDNQGRLWVATFGGGVNLMDFSGEQLRFIHSGNELKGYPINDYSRVRRIAFDKNDVMWISTNSGLLTCSQKFSHPSQLRFFHSSHVFRDTKSLLSSDVLQTLIGRDGKVYVVTLGGGVQQLLSTQPLADNLRFSRLLHHRSSDLVLSLAEDRLGRIWMVGESTIDRYDPKTQNTVRFIPYLFGDDIELSEAMPRYDATKDELTLAARGHLIRFSPEKLKHSNYQPNIVFTGVRYQGDRELQPLLRADELEVASDCRNLTIFFSAIDYEDRYQLKYAYKIEGIDKDWNYVYDGHGASFNRLPSGHHRLLVKSTNSDGVWMDNVATLDIYAHPTFGETPWVWVLYLLILVAIVYVAVYIQTLRNKALLEGELNEMKTKFFTDISHRLRTPLTLIGGPVNEVLKEDGLTKKARAYLEMVLRNTKEMLNLVDKMLRGGGDKQPYITDQNVWEVNIAPVEEIDSSNRQGDKMGPRLLVVEDNNDLRAFLVSILSSDYTVLQAANGEQGLKIAEEQMPDFIITDVMMPVMDGLTMVHRIKQNNDICHIPIIVLSAKASVEDRVQGLEEGIDDYITKPFSAIYLKSRVNNIIGQRQMLQQNYIAQLRPDDNRTYKLESPQIVDADNEMMKQLMAYLETHISDPDLKIEDLADAVHLGRSVFYGKIKSIVGMTPVDFVRHIRIQRAEELVIKSAYSFSQIAYEVGFSDPKYFSKCFKKETGMTPSEYRTMKNG